MAHVPVGPDKATVPEASGKFHPVRDVRGLSPGLPRHRADRPGQTETEFSCGVSCGAMAAPVPAVQGCSGETVATSAARRRPDVTARSLPVPSVWTGKTSPWATPSVTAK